MTLPSTPTVRSVTVPGARLHYEVRGTGPLVLVIGSPMASAEFAPLADALAGDHTVVTYDPRGYADSTVDDPDAQSDAGAARRRRQRDPRRPRRRVGRRVRVQRRRGHGPGVGRPASGTGAHARRPRAAAAGVAARRRRSSARTPRPSSTRSTATDSQAAWMHFMVNAGFDVSPDDAPVGPCRAVRRRDPPGRPVLRHRPASDDPIPARHRRAEEQPVARGDRHRRRLRPAAHLPDVGRTVPNCSAARRSSSPAITADSWAQPTEFADTLRSMLSASTASVRS